MASAPLFLTLTFLCSLSACRPGSPTADAGPSVNADAGGDDAGLDGPNADAAVGDAGLQDAGHTLDAGPAADAGAPSVCTPGSQIDCTSLAAIYESGSATCATNGRVWNVRSCVWKQVTGKRVSETVYPRQRDPVRWANARCNYEGDFVFEITLPEVFNGTWELELEGGGQCFNDTRDDCGTREFWKILPWLPPSNGQPTRPFPPDRTIESVARVDSSYPVPEISNGAIQVRANYCSSDLWTGTDTVGDEITYFDDPRTPGMSNRRRWVWTGRFNVRAMMDMLVERYGLDDTDPRLKVHVRGQSAGGVGVVNNAHVFRSYLPTASASQRVMISGWHGSMPTDWNPALDCPTCQNPNPWWYGGLMGVTGAQGLALATGIWGTEFDPTCAAANPSQPSRCLHTSVLYPYITNSRTESPAGYGMPLLVWQNLQDQVYTSLIGMAPLNVADPANADSRLIRQAWSSRLRNELSVAHWRMIANDPTMKVGNRNEPNLHPPESYFDAAPGGSDRTLQALTRRFWSMNGRPDWRTSGMNQVIEYDCNWFTFANDLSLRNCP